jgi:hypothetical protein
MAAARKVLSRRPVQVAARLMLILLLAAGLAALTLIAAPAHAGDEGDGPVTALVGAAPPAVSSYAPDLVAPVGEETRGNDYGRDWQHCVQVVANLRAKHPKVPLVVLLGGSSARECTVLDDDWEQQIKRRSKYVVDAYNLGSKHRTYAQDLAFVKLLPAKVPTIVYIGVNLGRFCLPAGSAAITLPRPRPLRHYPQHVYSSKRIQSSSTKRYYVSYWLTARYPEFRANYSTELGMLEKIIRTCKARHLRVALVDLPRDLPVIGSSFNGPVSRYYAGCASLARTWHIPWLHFNGAAHFRDGDFFDIFHLVEPGRAKFQSILSDKTIRLLRQYHMPKPTPTPTPSPSPSPSSSPSASASPSPSPSPAPAF